jgi:PPK2 family polyphosphate:nucleotide phosphotransferase
MKLDCQWSDFVVPQGSDVNLNKWPTRVQALSRSKKHYRSLLSEYRSQIADLQNVLYAHNRYALLLIFQGMDTAGKGGAIKHVMSGVNPQGCQVFVFGPPSQEELDHDYLWRTNKCLPERGRIGIFDRSYYEEVLVVRVKPQVLARQQLPKELADPKTMWEERYRDIVNMESYLHRNGTRIVKFFLHLSKEEQRKRLLARIEDPNKNWKMTKADLESRREWEQFQDAFEKCLSNTSTEHSPWYVIPADRKRNARLIISQIILETMTSLKMAVPQADVAHLEELREAKQILLAEKTT